MAPRRIGWWRGDLEQPTIGVEAFRAALWDFDRTLIVVAGPHGPALASGGQAFLGEAPAGGNVIPIVALAPPCRPEDLGDPTFRSDHRLRYAYVAGAMAGGIGSAEIVEAMGRAGMLGVFGAAGLPVERIERALVRIAESLGHAPHAANLIFRPDDPQGEAEVVGLYLRHGVRLIEASAYITLTLPLVRYRVHGIHRDAQGRIVVPNRVIAKVSRVEVASRFFAPPPEKHLCELVRTGEITPEQAELAARIPMAQDLTAEADSGGHTDNRPAISLLPTMLALRDRLQAQYAYADPLRVGAAGGIATPASVAAAYAMGAAYVLTGSINQACVESGTSDAVREMLAGAQQADVAMAPAADMFAMGVRVQVLKRGTMFPMRASKLYELYRNHASLEAIPEAQRQQIEKDTFRAPLEDVWRQTRDYFERHDPAEAERAERDPQHKMALVFRWYLGLASRWATSGEPARRADYQIWCGPAMGAFNEWAKGSFLEQPAHRRVVTVARNLMEGAAYLQRLHALRCQGILLPDSLGSVAPREFA